MEMVSIFVDKDNTGLHGPLLIIGVAHLLVATCIFQILIHQSSLLQLVTNQKLVTILSLFIANSKIIQLFQL